MMRLNLERVRANVRQAATEDLLDRATTYRDGMEPEALDIIEAELRQRGVSWEDIAEHDRKRGESALLDSCGLAVSCHWCRRPAVGESWGWHYLWGLVPIFPHRFAWCAMHKPH
jgi:hypothetical protein